MSEDFESSSEEPDSTLYWRPYSIACPAAFLKQYNRLSDVFWSFGCNLSGPPLARIAALDTVSITTKANLKAGSTAWDKRGSFMRRRWSLAIAGLIVILAGGLLAHLTQTSGGIRMCTLRAPRATP
jgi:hypothetical protein